jgi:hypothetical protein
LDKIPRILQGQLAIAAKISALNEGNVAFGRAGASRLQNGLIREPGRMSRKSRDLGQHNCCRRTSQCLISIACAPFSFNDALGEKL